MGGYWPPEGETYEDPVMSSKKKLTPITTDDNAPSRNDLARGACGDGNAYRVALLVRDHGAIVVKGHSDPETGKITFDSLATYSDLEIEIGDLGEISCRKTSTE